MNGTSKSVTVCSLQPESGLGRPPLIEPAFRVEFNLEQLQAALKKVIGFVSTDSHPFHKNWAGINFIWRKSEPTKIQAMNRYQLAEATLPASKVTQEGYSIVPVVIKAAMAKALLDQPLTAETATLAVELPSLSKLGPPKAVAFEVANTVIVADRLGEYYPDFKQLIRLEKGGWIECERQPLIKAISRVQGKAKPALVNVIAKSKKLVIESENGSEILPYNGLIKLPRGGKFNGMRLLKGLRSFSGQSIKLQLGKLDHPKSVYLVEDGLIHLLMAVS